MPLHNISFEHLEAATKLLKGQINLIKEVLTQEDMSHTDENVIGLAQVLATNLLCISTNNTAKEKNNSASAKR